MNFSKISGVSIATLLVALVSAVSLMSAGVAQAATIQIGALGASIVCGKGVGSDAAFPQLIANMLKAKGYDVSMAVSCANGADGAAILGLIGGIPAGTRIIIYTTGGINNTMKGESLNAFSGQIASAVRARGAIGIRAAVKQIGGVEYQADGIHPTASGHRRIAAALLPQVAAALGRAQR
jgi:lysophospholipase L1-like esterase